MLPYLLQSELLILSDFQQRLLYKIRSPAVTYDSR
jgi:hypothetical protein